MQQRIAQSVERLNISFKVIAYEKIVGVFQVFDEAQKLLSDGEAFKGFPRVKISWTKLMNKNMIVRELNKVFD